jgi:hypothetical protein
MKTIIATTIALTIATTASATNWSSINTDPTWNGDSKSYHVVGCKYKDLSAGVMEIDPDSLVWTTTTPAKVKIRSYGQGNVKVTTDGYLSDGTTSFATTVDYTGANGTNGASQVISLNGKLTNGQVNTQMISYQASNTGRTKAELHIGGTATMTDATSDNITNDTDYTITHTVTCLQ